MSKKLIVMQRLTTLLEGLTTYTYKDAVGTSHTATYALAGRVYRGRKTVSETDARASMSILEAPRPVDGDGVGADGQVRRFDWRLNIQGWPVEDRNHPSDPAYIMAAAVEQRLQRISAVKEASGDPLSGQAGLYPEYHLSGLIDKITVFDSLVLPATEGLSKVAFFYIPVTVSIIRDLRKGA